MVIESLGTLGSLSLYGMVATSVTTIASQVINMSSSSSRLSSGSSQAQQVYFPKVFQAPTMPNISDMLSSTTMPEIPQVAQYQAAPTPKENIISADNTQNHRMGNVKAAYFSDEYDSEKTGAVSSTMISEDNSGSEKTAINQVLG